MKVKVGVMGKLSENCCPAILFERSRMLSLMHWGQLGARIRSWRVYELPGHQKHLSPHEGLQHEACSCEMFIERSVKRDEIG